MLCIFSAAFSRSSSAVDVSDDSFDSDNDDEEAMLAVASAIFCAEQITASTN
jgi:hypothetical protein